MKSPCIASQPLWSRNSNTGERLDAFGAHGQRQVVRQLDDRAHDRRGRLGAA